jgi:hypothetical protein
MPRALYRTDRSSAAEDVAAAAPRLALRPVGADKSMVPAGRSADVMINPPHPMHQDLLARISGARAMETKLPRPQRLAIAFYGSLAAWALVWLTIQLIKALL